MEKQPEKPTKRRTRRKPVERIFEGKSDIEARAWCAAAGFPASLFTLMQRQNAREVEAAREAAQLEAGTHERVTTRGRYGGRVEHVWAKTKAAQPRCNATTRKGQPCAARVVVRSDGSHATKCRFHGGLSTGPKTEQGRAAIAASNRRRAQVRRGQAARDATAPNPEPNAQNNKRVISAK